MSDYHRQIWLQDEGFKSTIQAVALVDTGATDNFISEQVVRRLDAKIYPYRGHVLLGNGQKQAIHGSVGLHFGLYTQRNRWQDQFIVVAGLPYDVVFGRELNDRLKFFLRNPLRKRYGKQRDRQKSMTGRLRSRINESAKKGEPVEHRQNISYEIRM
ncbi:uncharacterized protein LTHEOB_2933 [Lasiodiplodia theobromae]|uniref:uncharacterized protein n=1 Tax=Lasiodiplodia theobromae TaxID=45133 RepID=UPI0015C3BFCD|nr:uncharacterized protein LTHEOB_2933 [Lasiodiplodia theobromae]KAF4534958.1 hypothetical protein LTHEOB_2933 [Lasiodiplodia theobromae]